MRNQHILSALCMVKTLHKVSLIFTATLQGLVLKRVVYPVQDAQLTSDKSNSNSYLSGPQVQFLSTRPGVAKL